MTLVFGPQKLPELGKSLGAHGRAPATEDRAASRTHTVRRIRLGARPQARRPSRSRRPRASSRRSCRRAWRRTRRRRCRRPRGTARRRRRPAPRTTDGRASPPSSVPPVCCRGMGTQSFRRHIHSHARCSVAVAVHTRALFAPIERCVCPQTDERGAGAPRPLRASRTSRSINAPSCRTPACPVRTPPVRTRTRRRGRCERGRGRRTAIGREGAERESGSGAPVALVQLRNVRHERVVRVRVREQRADREQDLGCRARTAAAAAAAAMCVVR